MINQTKYYAGLHRFIHSRGKKRQKAAALLLAACGIDGLDVERLISLASPSFSLDLRVILEDFGRQLAK